MGVVRQFFLTGAGNPRSRVQNAEAGLASRTLEKTDVVGMHKSLSCIQDHVNDILGLSGGGPPKVRLVAWCKGWFVGCPDASEVWD